MQTPHTHPAFTVAAAALKPEMSRAAVLPAIRRYALALGLTACALGLALAAEFEGFQGVEVPLLLMAVGAAVWYGGTGPGALAIVLSSVSVDFFFTEPRFTFEINAADRAYFAVFVLFGVMIGVF